MLDTRLCYDYYHEPSLSLRDGQNVIIDELKPTYRALLLRSASCISCSVEILKKPVVFGRQLGLKSGCQRTPNGTNQTYSKHLKDHIEVLPPRGDLIFITSREEESKYGGPFALLSDLSLYINQSPTIETSAMRTHGIHID
jgi:hypothetical protein